MEELRIKRAYEPAEPDDGYRVYVDRLWPRGLSHTTFHYDLWDKNIAPSTQLREWFHSDPVGRWDEFVKRYASELRANPAFASLKTVLAGHPKVTLLYSSHDSAHNNAAVLREVIEGGLIVDLPEKSRGGGAIATGRPAASKPKTD